MRYRLTIDDLLEMLLDKEFSESWCECHGHLRQIDARLPNEKPIRLMKSSQGYHLIIGKGKSLGDYPEPPTAIHWRQVERTLLRELGL